MHRSLKHHQYRQIIPQLPLPEDYAMAEEIFLPEVWRRAVERQIDTLRSQMETIQTEVAAVNGKIEERVTHVFDKLNEITEELENKIEENTAKTESVQTDTSEVVSILRDWKGAMNVLKFTSKVIAPVGLILTVATGIVAILAKAGLL